MTIHVVCASERTLPELVLRHCCNSLLSAARNLTSVSVLYCHKSNIFLTVLYYSSGVHVLSVCHCSTDATSQVALNALLERSREVLLQFMKDEPLAGSCPLPR